MPAYVYSCVPCNKLVTLTKPMAQSGDPAYCGCGAPMERVYTPVATNVPGGTPIHHDRAWLRYGQAAKSQERKG